ncbi:MAG TPA: hypothetical protein VLH84_04450 [Patescibacteria group bacterium]|nr:hypothetical protein [Patescibacteria group bacterium]
MRIEGEQISLTPSEAGWIALQFARLRFLDFARKVELARRTAIAVHLPDGIFDGVPLVSADMPYGADGFPDTAVGLRRISADHAMHRAEAEHARDADGAELHTIQVPAGRDELAIMAERASFIHMILQQEMLDPPSNPDRTYEDRIVEFDDGDDDPEPHLNDSDAAQIDAMFFANNLTELEVTAGILATLRQAGLAE